MSAYQQQTAAAVVVATGLTRHVISRLAVVVLFVPTWSTCCNVQPQKAYDVIFDVIRCISEALDQELR